MEHNILTFDGSAGHEGTCTKEQPPGETALHAVLQTYTLPLAQVRQDLKNWAPSWEYEVSSLEQDLPQEPGYAEMLVVGPLQACSYCESLGWKKSALALILCEWS